MSSMEQNTAWLKKNESLGDAELQSTYPDRNRLAGAIRAAYNEAR